MDLYDIRKNYDKAQLDQNQLLENPIKQIELWVEEAGKAKSLEHTAIVLSTVSPDKQPSSRVVLLKHIDEDGLYIFTNYESRKGQQIATNNKGSMLLFWPELERQINIEGTIEKVNDEMSDQYFNSRPVDSRISAVASRQSQEIPSRASMEDAWNEVANKAEDSTLQRPPYWGGYRLRPHRIEFWQGRPNRFHDRIVFDLKHGNWLAKRIMP